MRAFLVCGPESSGNCYLTRLLCEAGCAGRGAGEQPFDGPGCSVVVPEPRPPLVAVVRSFPHGGTWPDLASQVQQLRDQGYRVMVLVTVRDQHSQFLSQLRAGHADSWPEYTSRYVRAYRDIFSGVLASGAAFLLVPYACLGRERYRDMLRGILELPGPFLEPFIDGDAKYEARVA